MSLQEIPEPTEAMIDLVATALVEVGIYPRPNQVGHTREAYRRWAKAAILAMEAAREPEAGKLREALEPFADYHGDLPDYDHALRPVYESGIQYAVELLAKILGVEDYDICDGTEEFDGDLGGTLLNIVIKTWPTDEHGDWVDLRDSETRTALSRNQGR
jgi:hypothetical protein